MVRENVKPGEKIQAANERASQGVSRYVPVSKPISAAPSNTTVSTSTVHVSVSSSTATAVPVTTSATAFTPVHVPAAITTSSEYVPVPSVPATTISGRPPASTASAVTSNRFAVLAPSTTTSAGYVPASPNTTAFATVVSGRSPASTQTPATITRAPVSYSTVVSVCAGSVPTSAPAITQPVCASSTAVPGSHFVSLSPHIPTYIPYGATPAMGYYPGTYGVMAPYQVYDPSLGRVAYNYQTESVPSNRSFAAGRIGYSHSARDASSDDEYGGGNYDSFPHGENDGFPSEPEPMRDNDCTWDAIRALSGSSSVADYVDNSLNDDGYQQATRRSDRLKSKKDKGLSVGSTVTGRKKRR